MNQALSLVAAGMTKVKWDSAYDGVYGKCIVRTQNHRAEVVVQGAHTRITEERLDGDLVASRLLRKQIGLRPLARMHSRSLDGHGSNFGCESHSLAFGRSRVLPTQLAVREAAIGRKSAPASPL